MEAPLSSTMTIWMFCGRPRPRMKDSVSRPAVPFPMAMASMPYFFASTRIRSAACGQTLRPRMRIDRLVFDQFSLRVQAHHLAPGAKTGIYRHDIPESQGRRHQEMTQVIREYPDSLAVRLFLAPLPGFRLKRRRKQPLVTVLNGGPDLLRRRRIAFYKKALQNG